MSRKLIDNIFDFFNIVFGFLFGLSISELIEASCARNISPFVAWAPIVLGVLSVALFVARNYWRSGKISGVVQGR